MSEVNIGHEPSEFAQRDAIHVAVIPAISGDNLNAGDDVKIGDDGLAYMCPFSQGVGIVDPFCYGDIDPGKRFWLFLKPNSITGMRHHWEHPKFPDSREPRPATTEIEDARVWLAVKMGQVGWYRGFDDFCCWLSDIYWSGYFRDFTERREEWSNGSYIYDLIVGCDRQTAIKCLQSVLGREIREKPLDDYGYRCSC